MNKPTPYDLLKECFDEIKHCDDPLGRKSILQAYEKHMEAREAGIRREAMRNLAILLHSQKHITDAEHENILKMIGQGSLDQRGQ